MKRKTLNLLRGLKKPAVIVLGGSAQAGLSIVRSLGRKKVPVIVVDLSAPVMSSYSKYCLSSEACSGDNSLLDFLDEAKSISKHKNVIFCQNDEYVLFVDRYKNRLASGYHLPVALDLSMSDIINKKKMMEIAKTAGLDIPFTVSSDDDISLLNVPQKYPLFIKPLTTQTAVNTKGEIVHNYDDLLRMLKTFRFDGGYIIQEIIQGPETEVWEYLGYIGNGVRGSTVGHKIRQIPKDFGAGTVAVSKNNSKIVELGDKFLNSIGYLGFFDIEFKLDERDGKYKFIEINPRLCGFNELALGAGVDLSYIAYCNLTDTNSNYSYAMKEGVLWTSFIDDFITCFKYYSKTDSLIMLNWIKTAFKADRDAIFRLSDIKPFIFRVVQLLFSSKSKKVAK